ncbi:hypothetical protein [Streptomyces mirabilis]
MTTTPRPAPPPSQPHGLIVLEGYLDDRTIPEDGPGASVRFQLAVSPTDDRLDDLLIPCTVVGHPQLAHAVMHDLGISDLLRISGHLQLPQEPGDGLRLHVNAIQVLDSGVDLSRAGSKEGLEAEVLAESGRIERRGNFQMWHDPGARQSSVWHASGEWVDSTDDPNALDDLIAAHQQRATPLPVDTPNPGAAPVSPPPPSRRRLTSLRRIQKWLRRT